MPSSTRVLLLIVRATGAAWCDERRFFYGAFNTKQLMKSPKSPGTGEAFIYILHNETETAAISIKFCRRSAIKFIPIQNPAT